MIHPRPSHVLASATLVLALAVGALAAVPVERRAAAQAEPAAMATSDGLRASLEWQEERNRQEQVIEPAEPDPVPEPEPEPEPEPKKTEPEPKPEPEPEPEPEPAPKEPEGLLPRVDAEALETIAGRTGIPRRVLQAYAGAALWAGEHQPGCNLDWALLAAIGYVESRHGTIRGGHIAEDGYATTEIIGIPLNGSNGTRKIRDTDGGSLDRDTTWDRAVGPMQFIPGTWHAWGVDASQNGEANPHHIDDAALSAARYLCASGDLSDADTWWRAVLRYNQSEHYARAVLNYNNHYARMSHG